MGFDKGTITNGTVVTISLLAIVGLLLAGATPAAAQSNETADDGPPEFDFDINDGANFEFSGDNSTGDDPDFDFGGIGDESPFDFSGIGGDGEAPDFSGIGGDGESPFDFSGIGGDGETPDFTGIGENGATPNFSGIGENGAVPNFSGIGDDGETPDFGGGDGDDGGDGDETAPADFQVSNLNAPTEATVGDTISVSTDVENVGGSEGTQSVSFGIDTDDDGELEERATQDETLASGASTTVTFDVDTSDLTAGTYTHGVATANDSATAQITLASQQPDQPANFQVSNVDTNSPVTEGETLTVDATVENVGDREGTQTITLSALDESASTEETLAAGASTAVTLSVPTQSGDAGSATATVQTANDSESTSVQVNAPDSPANFQVSGVNSNSPVTEGDTLIVNATIQNTGTQEGTQTVDLTVNGTVRDDTSVMLSGGASQDVSLSWSTASGDAGDYSATISSANDTGSTSVTVNTDSDSGTPEYQSFTAYTEDGYISVGTDENAGYGEIPHCPQGEAETSTGCVYFNASFDQSTGEYTVTPGNFHFPVINFSSNTLGPVPTNNTASGTITGSLSTETGESTFSAPIFAELELGTEGCGIPVNVEGTTGQSGNLTGTPADPATFDQNGTAEATLVDNELSVPTTEGCGILGSTIDSDVGLPAPSGENEIVLELYIEFHQEPVDQLGN